MFDNSKKPNNVFILILAIISILLTASAVIIFLFIDTSGHNVSSLIITLCLAAAFWFLFYLYKTLESENENKNHIAYGLIKKLSNKNEDIADMEKLGETLFSSLEELEKNISRLNLIDRDVHLIRLLKGPDQDFVLILEKLREYNVEFPYDGFLLICFKREKIQNPIHFEIRDNVTKKGIIDSLDEDLNAYVVDLEDYYACIQNVGYVEDDESVRYYKDKADKFIQRVFKKLEEESGIYLSAAVSELHRGVYELPTAYKEVDGLFEYKKITANDSRIILYTDYYVSHDSWYNFGNTYHKFDEVRRLITSIQVSDFANAKTLITDLIENDYSKQYPSLLLARCRKFGIIDAAINAMGLIKNDLDEEFLRELDPTTKIVNCLSYNDLERTLNEIFDAIIDYFKVKNKELPPSWFENTLSYIDKHYNDPEINVSAIADHFDINSAYYARVFKKYTGISPLDYIHKLRMKSAKELMGKGISVKDAACIVGYGNPLTMSRAFKRYEGITPGSFVKNVSQLADKY